MLGPKNPAVSWCAAALLAAVLGAEPAAADAPVDVPAPDARRAGAELYFAPGAIGFDAGQLARLKKRIPLLAAAPDGWRIVVEGHADAVGDGFANDDLARTRAEYVAALLEKSGVPRAKIHVAARGEEAATATGDWRARAPDRRVVVRLVKEHVIVSSR